MMTKMHMAEQRPRCDR